MSEIVLNEQNISSLVSAFTAKSAFYNATVENFLIAADALYHAEYITEYPDPNALLSDFSADEIVDKVLTYYHK